MHPEILTQTLENILEVAREECLARILLNADLFLFKNDFFYVHWYFVYVVRVLDLLELELADSCELPRGFWELNLGPGYLSKPSKVKKTKQNKKLRQFWRKKAEKVHYHKICPVRNAKGTRLWWFTP